MKKNTTDPFMKYRIIISTCALLIIMAGWVIYGIKASYSNPNRVLVKLLNNEKEDLNKRINKIDLKYYLNSKISTGDSSYYIKKDKDKLYLYNNNEYHDLSKDLGNYNIKISDSLYKNDHYKVIINSFISAITRNYKLLDYRVLKDNKKHYYVYNFSLSSLEPIILTMIGNKEFTDNMNDLFGLNKDELKNLLYSIKDKTFGISIITKGYKRDIVYYNIKIESVLSIIKQDDYINGFIFEKGFTYKDKKLTIHTEKNDYDIKINKNDKLDIDGKKEVELNDIFTNKKN